MENLSEISISSTSRSSSDPKKSDSHTENSSDMDNESREKMKEQKKFLKSIKRRIRQIDDKFVEVKLGTECHAFLQILQDKKKSRIEVATALKEFKLTNLNHEHESKEQSIRQNFENDKNILYDTIKADLEEQIQRLEEERNEAKMYASLWLDRKKPEPKRKPVVVSGPCIVYNLHEHEILEDWIAIKRSLSSSK